MTTTVDGVDPGGLWDFVKDFHESFLGKIVHPTHPELSLSYAIGELASDDPRRRDQATETIRKIIHRIFGREFLTQFAATWGAVLLWDDFHRTFINTKGFTTHPDSYGRYQITSSLVDTEHFRAQRFAEPMTDLIFQSQNPQPLVIVWENERQAAATSRPAGPPGPQAERYTLNIGRLVESDAKLRARLTSLKAEMTCRFEQRPNGALHAEWFATTVRGLAEETLQSLTIKYELLKYVEHFNKTYGVSQKDSIKENNLPSVLQAFIWNRLFDDDWTHLYFLPAQLPGSRAVSGLVLACSRELQHPAYSAVVEIVNRVLSIVHFNLYDHQKNRFARRAAVAAIMARNMSHNIGSHVMPRTRAELVDRRLEDLTREHPGGTVMHAIAGALRDRLDDYIQKKADFLSEITTEPLMSMRPAMLFREVLLPFMENPLIIDNLAANEGVRFRLSGRGAPESGLRFVLTVRRDGEEKKRVRASYSCPPDECLKRRCSPAQHDVIRGLATPGFTLRCPFKPDVELHPQIEDSDADVQIDLPGPLGEFAVYGFLENLIRNAAKHNRKKVAADGLTITIDVEDDPEDPDHYHVSIHDDASLPDQEVLVKTDNEQVRMPLFKYIQDQLSIGFIDHDGKTPSQAWGLKEMLVCASLLSGTTDFAIPQSKPPLTVSNDGGKLTYTFRIVRSRHAAALLPEWDTQCSPALMETLRRQGIDICRTWKDFDDMLDGRSARRAVSFAVFDVPGYGEADKERAFFETLRKRAPQLPLRVLIFDPDTRLRHNLPKGFLTLTERFEHAAAQWTDATNILRWLWPRWLQRWLVEWQEVPRLSGGIHIPPDPGRNAIVHVFLDQDKGVEPTERWRENARIFNHENRQNTRVSMAVWARDTDATAVYVERPLRRGHVDVLVDRHGGLSGFFADQNPPEAYMVLDKDSPDFVTLFSPAEPKDRNAWLWPWELAEAGLLRILVIDERVAETAYHPAPKGVNDASHWGALPQLQGIQPQRWHCLWTANVFVTTHFGFDAEPETLHRSLAQADGRVAARDPTLTVTYRKRSLDIALRPRGSDTIDTETIKPVFDLALVHQGVLDNRCNGGGKELLAALHEAIGPVVIESGRGVPLTLAPDERFLPFSLVQHYLLGRQIGKLGLTRIAMGLARSRRATSDD